MFIRILIGRIFEDPVEVLKFVLEVIIIYAIIRFRHQARNSIIDIPQTVVKKLILDYEPDDLIESKAPLCILERLYEKTNIDLASYDVFQIQNKFKKETKEIIKKYGIGTCGPTTFFGTLDLHIKLQDKISMLLGTEDSLLYSNSFTCIHSIISCFATNSDIIFYNKFSSEGIIRGIALSKATCYEYEDINNLDRAIKMYSNPKKRNFIVVEGLSKNLGTVLDLKKIIKLKEDLNFRIILDESLSIPLLNKKGVCGYFNIEPRLIDIRIGSFSYGYACSGGFFTGDKNLANYQRLSSSSYVFSASLPGFLANFNILALDLDLNYCKIRRKIAKFHKYFDSKVFNIISDKVSPIIIIRSKDIDQDKASILTGLYKIVHELRNKRINVGINSNPVPSIRLVMKIRQKEVKKLAKIISETCDSVEL
ncbi:hypothetical protein P3W45_000533 [Vairimorpha bombi]|jgi:serine palmitoyltransferase